MHVYRNCQGLIAQSDLVKEKLDDLLSVAAAAAPREPRFLSQDPGAVNGGSDDAVDEAIAMVEQEATLLRSEVLHNHEEMSVTGMDVEIHLVIGRHRKILNYSGCCMEIMYITSLD